MILNSVLVPIILVGGVAKAASAKELLLLLPGVKLPATYSKPSGIRITTNPLVPVWKLCAGDKSIIWCLPLNSA